MRIYLIAFSLFFSSLFSSIEAKEKPYYASICAIFQNEAPYLREWIEYHLLLGFEHFYLYNNNSDDGYQTVLEPYINRGIVDLIEWPNDYVQDFDPVQKGAYNHCIKKNKSNTYWIAIIDIDEFIVPIRHSKIRAFLEPYDKNKSIGSISMYWQFFGTSHLAKIPDGKLLIESLTLKADVSHAWNRNCKAIFKPKTIDYFHVHGAIHKSGYRNIATNGQSGPNVFVIDQIRVNHYWTRAEDFFYEIKLPRRAKFLGREMTEYEITSLNDSFNAIEDTAIQKFVPALRKRIFGHL